MKIGEMNANLLKQLRHKKMTKDIKSSSAKVVLAAAIHHKQGSGRWGLVIQSKFYKFVGCDNIIRET